MSALRILYMGTAELAVVSFDALCRADEFQVLAAVTQPDRPKGRELKLQFSPVKEMALKANVPMLQPERARDAGFIEKLRQLQLDLIVVVAYGQLLPPDILELPRFGCLNVHTSLLPKYRGAAPIQWAILDDQPETGVTVMQMDAGLDTGPILTQARTAIAKADNAQTLHDRLASLGAELLVQTIPDYVAGKIQPQPQSTQGASYARKIVKEDGRLDWMQPARTLWNRVRAFVPWPGTFTFRAAAPKQCRLKIWSAEIEPQRSGPAGTVVQADQDGIVVACGQQALRILQLQREGGRRLTAQEFLAGHDLRAGEQLD